MIQKTDLGGFSVVSIPLKVHALLVQWVRRFQESHGGWVSMLTFWLFDRFGADPSDVFDSPFMYSPDRLPPFYGAEHVRERGRTCFLSEIISPSSTTGNVSEIFGNLLISCLNVR